MGRVVVSVIRLLFSLMTMASEQETKGDGKVVEAYEIGEKKKGKEKVEERERRK